MPVAPDGLSDPPLRSPSHRSALTRQLSGYLPTPEEPARQDLAERLGAWLNVRDAIALHALHQTLPAMAVKRAPRAPGAAALTTALQQLRATLQRSIGTPPTWPSEAGDSDFAPIHHRYLDQQRRMETGVGALRAHVRQVLSAAAPQLAQLAALDHALDQLLGEREQKLLSGVPAFLKARFEQLRHSQPDTWPTAFEGELQQALLGELDLRLRPLLGMIDALAQAEALP